MALNIDKNFCNQLFNINRDFIMKVRCSKSALSPLNVETTTADEDSNVPTIADEVRSSLLQVLTVHYTIFNQLHLKQKSLDCSRYCTLTRPANCSQRH